jgi:hypothetical protein
MKRFRISWQLAVGSWQRINYRAYCLLLTAYCLLFSACNLINPASPVPSYLRIEKITLTTDPATQGSRNNAITDAWVFVDEQVIGVFQMPVNVPILFSGIHTITIKPGVILNGIAATRIDYPFYTSYVQTVNLVPGHIDTIQSASVTYNNCTFALLEDFDQAGLKLTHSPYYTDSIHIISDPAIGLLEGKCGAALLNAGDPSFWFTCIDSFPMPIGSIRYMEINYKGNYPFAVGLQSFVNGIAINNGDDIVILKPSSTWQKIYVDLNILNAQDPLVASATYFKVYMQSVLDLTVQPSAAIYFDNIKVIHNG